MMFGAFDTDPPVRTLKRYPTFLNVYNVPESAYELDEINQSFQRYSWEPRFPNNF
jgi:hypothetical protein